MTGSDEEWPPLEGRLRSIRWRAEAHLERSEFIAAACTLAEGFRRGGDDELLHGLHHLAAAGHRAQIGDFERARRQLAFARRRLARHPDSAPLIEAVLKSAGGEPSAVFRRTISHTPPEQKAATSLSTRNAREGPCIR
jgi:hypothetical protein